MSETSSPSTITVGRERNLTLISTGKPSTASAAWAASERSGEAANAAGAELPVPRPLVPDSEVVARPHRRRFSPEYKLSRSEEHTSELQSLRHLVCRLLLE